jgi:FKBP-type peptidyl-prolyl cis-trans isomerase
LNVRPSRSRRGTVDTAQSKNVRAALRFSPGVYCVDFTVQPQNVTATLVVSFGEIWALTESEFPLCTSPAGNFSTQVHNADIPFELGIDDLVEGEGAEATKGSKASVHYVGVAFSTGDEFDASWNRGEPFEFKLAPAR